MALVEDQYQIRDLVMGRGTIYRVTDDTQLMSRSNRNTGSGERAWNDGSWAGAQFREQIVVPISIVIHAEDKASVLAAIDELQAAFRPVYFGGDVEFRFNLGNGERMFMCRPIMCEVDLELLGVGSAAVQAAVEVNDTFLYSGEEYSILGMTLPTYHGGLTVPFTAPFVIDGYRLGGEDTVNYTGTREAGFRVVWETTSDARASLSQPSVAVIGPDGEMSRVTVDIDLGPNQKLTVDTFSKSVILGESTSRRGSAILEPPGQYPVLKPGENRIRFRGDGLPEYSTMSVFWRESWY